MKTHPFIFVLTFIAFGYQTLSAESFHASSPTYLKSVVQQEDFIVFANGDKWWGIVEEVPALDFSFGTMPFTPDEIAAMAIVKQEGELKIQYITHEGQHFIGSSGPGKLLFKETRIPHLAQSAEVNMVSVNFLILQRRNAASASIQKNLYYLTFENGDLLSVYLDPDADLTLSDGWENHLLKTKEILDVSCEGGLIRGCYARAGKKEELTLSFVNEPYLTVQIAGTSQKFKFPWSKISSISGTKAPTVAQTIAYEEKPLKTVNVSKEPEQLSKAEMTFQMNVLAEMPFDDLIGLEEMVYVPYAKVVVPVCEFTSHTGLPFSQNLFPTVDSPSCIVEVGNFYMDQHEVTNKEYLEFVMDSNYSPPSHWVDGKIPEGWEDSPVVNVSYKDAEAYASWAGKRLPTEIEWTRVSSEMKASNSGKLNYIVEKPIVAIGHIPEQDEQVAEWTSSPFLSPAIPSLWMIKKLLNPRGYFNANFKVVRRSASLSPSKTLPVVYRLPMSEEDCNGSTGFRCVSGS